MDTTITKKRKTATGATKATRVSKIAKRVDKETPGYLCFRLEGSQAPAKRAPYDPTRRQEVKKVRQLGACLRCRWLKTRCSGGDPCDHCLAAAATRHASRALGWTECVRPSLAKLKVFSPRLEKPAWNSADLIKTMFEDFNNDVRLEFPVPFQWTSEDAAGHIVKWLRTEEEQFQFSVTGLLSTLDFSVMLAKHMGSHLAKCIRTLVYMSSYIYSYGLQGDSAEWPQPQFLQAILEETLAELDKRLTRLTRKSIAGVPLEERYTLFLALFATTLAGSYTVTALSEEVGQGGEQQICPNTGNELLRLLSHYLFLVGQESGLLRDATDSTHIFLGSVAEQWNKPSNYRWFPQDGSDMSDTDDSFDSWHDSNLEDPGSSEADTRVLPAGDLGMFDSCELDMINEWPLNQAQDTQGLSYELARRFRCAFSGMDHREPDICKDRSLVPANTHSAAVTGSNRRENNLEPRRPRDLDSSHEPLVSGIHTSPRVNEGTFDDFPDLFDPLPWDTSGIGLPNSGMHTSDFTEPNALSNCTNAPGCTCLVCANLLLTPSWDLDWPSLAADWVSSLHEEQLPPGQQAMFANDKILPESANRMESQRGYLNDPVSLAEPSQAWLDTQCSSDLGSCSCPLDPSTGHPGVTEMSKSATRHASQPSVDIPDWYRVYFYSEERKQIECRPSRRAQTSQLTPGACRSTQHSKGDAIGPPYPQPGNAKKERQQVDTEIGDFTVSGWTAEDVREMLSPEFRDLHERHASSLCLCGLRKTVRLLV